VGDGVKAQTSLSSLAGECAGLIDRLLAEPLSPGLYVVATPIGNLADITLRALAVLAQADVLYCEDTRRSRTLLSRFAIQRSVRTYQEHNAAAERPRVLAELAQGKSVAIISDAGTPLISDPGYKLVRETIAAGHPVISLPGPSALLAALVSAGLPNDAFLFVGFLPARRSARRERLKALAPLAMTLVMFEAPSRLASALEDIAAMLGEREAVVARELTKLHEEVRRGSLTQLARWAAHEPPKGEMVVLVGPPPMGEVSDAAISQRLRELRAQMPLSAAARAVARELGVPRTRAYTLGLALGPED